MAETYQAGSERHGLFTEDGTDELSISGVSWVEMLQEDGKINEAEIHPEILD